MWPGQARRRHLERGKPRDVDTEGGTQPADKSLINRRLSLHLQPCAAPISVASAAPTTAADQTASSQLLTGVIRTSAGAVRIRSRSIQISLGSCVLVGQEC